MAFPISPVLTEITESYQTQSGFTEWEITTSYSIDNIVNSLIDGDYYICTVGGTSAGDASDLANGSDTGVTWIFYATGPRINKINIKT